MNVPYKIIKQYLYKIVSKHIGLSIFSFRYNCLKNLETSNMK